MLKAIAVGVVTLFFAVGIVSAQTASPSPSPSPSPTTVVPSGAPSTGFGK